jgi:hypothetical protein
VEMIRSTACVRAAHAIRGSAVVAILLVAILALAACTRAPAEERLRQRIGDMVAAVESGDVGGFLDGVSTDFSGNGGEYDRRQLHAMLRAIALRHRDIGVTHGPLEIELHGADRATVKVTAIVTGGSGGLLPETGRHIAIDSGWREEDGEWRCISARWRE